MTWRALALALTTLVVPKQAPNVARPTIISDFWYRNDLSCAEAGLETPCYRTSLRAFNPSPMPVTLKISCGLPAPMDAPIQLGLQPKSSDSLEVMTDLVPKQERCRLLNWAVSNKGAE